MTIKKDEVAHQKMLKKRIKQSKKKLKHLQDYARYNTLLIVNYFGKENTRVLVATETDSCYIEVHGLLKIRMSNHRPSGKRYRIRRDKPTIYYESNILLSEKKLESDVDRVMNKYEGIS